MTQRTNVKKKSKKKSRVMAIAPQTRGFGYVVFDGPAIPHRWGVKEASSKNELNMFHIASLISEHRPEMVVVEDYAGEGSRRAKRIQLLIDDIASFAEGRGIGVYRYSRARMRECFSDMGAFTKYEIAIEIAKALPEFAPVLPPKRKIWLPEDPRMGIFDAAALVFSFFYFSTQRKRAA